MLTGRVSEHLALVQGGDRSDDVYAGESVEPVIVLTLARRHRRFAAHTVYLSDSHLRDVDRIIEAWQQVEPRRLTRSAVLRRAVDYLRAAVEADPANFLLENE
jgi:hypothetical protein